MPTNQKYPHRRSIRLQNYDYRQAGFYFVTICTQDQKCMFGEIVKGEMYLNGAGSLAQSIWSTLPERFAHIELDQYMVMPNHLHGIMVLTGSPSMPKRDVDTANVPERFMHAKGRVHQGHAPNMGSQQSRIHHIPTLGEIIRTFKGLATSRIHSEGKPDFAWQASFYEHIIRNDDDLDRIRHSIVNNPARWAEDRLYTRT